MSDTVLLSLITGSAGVVGALLGAAASVYGPARLQESQRKARETRDSKEARRLAIVRWCGTTIALVNIDPHEPVYSSLVVDANKAMVELSSRLSLAEDNVEQWLHGVAETMDTTWNVDRRRAVANIGSRWLLEWNRGTRRSQNLTPFYFGIDSRGFVFDVEPSTSWPDLDDPSHRSH